MEELISAGKVSVNGKPARLGARVGPHDRITVAGEPVGEARAPRANATPQVVLYHKPEGEIVSRRDPEGRPSVFDRVPIVRRGRWLAVGRLDFNTCGLLIFTDSGELANTLTHPRFQVRRDYAVRVLGELTADHMHMLRAGVELDDGPARFDLLEATGGEGSNRWYRVRVHEGRNRLVRRLFAAAGFTVSRLMRTAFGPFELPPRVKRGQWLRMDIDDVKRALTALTHKEGAPKPEGGGRRDKRNAFTSERPSERRGERAGKAPAEERRRFKQPAKTGARDRSAPHAGGPHRASSPVDPAPARRPHRPPRRSRST